MGIHVARQIRREHARPISDLNGFQFMCSRTYAFQGQPVIDGRQFHLSPIAPGQDRIVSDGRDGPAQGIRTRGGRSQRQQWTRIMYGTLRERGHRNEESHARRA